MESTTHLVEAAQAGDVEAYGQLVQATQKYVEPTELHRIDEGRILRYVRRGKHSLRQ